MNKYNTKILKNLTIACVSMLVITACGGGGGGSDSDSSTPDVSSPVASMGITASNVSKAVYEEQATVVNLSSSIITTEGGTDNVKLSKVTPVTNSASCQDNYTYTQDLNFTVEGEGVGVCVYKYEVQSTDGTASATAYAQVAIAGSDSALVSNIAIAPISAVAQLDEMITVDTTAPSTSDGETFELSPTISILGSGTASVDTTTGEITYTAGSGEADTGVTRILYYYEGSEGTVLTGAVDVTVSTDTSNVNPTAKDWTYVTEDDVEAGNAYSSLSIGADVTVNLGVEQYFGENYTQSLIDDGDGDSLQLVDVISFNSDVEILTDSETDTDSLSFKFTAKAVGTYYVTYTVSDHNGGYASGIIAFHVESAWPSVVVYSSSGDDFVIAAPLSVEAANIAGYNYSAVADETATDFSVTNTEGQSNNGDMAVPTYTWSAANAICIARGGRLPTLDEMSEFMNQEGNPFLGVGDGDTDAASDTVQQAKDWPIARYYFTKTFSDTTGRETEAFAFVPTSRNEAQTANGGQFFSLVDTDIEEGTSYLGYLACVDKTPTALIIDNTLLLTDVDGQVLTASAMTAAQNTYEYTKQIYWTVSGDVDESLADEVMPDIENNVTVGYTTGTFNATAEGYVHIVAETGDGKLIASKDIEVIRNLLAVDFDYTFESFPVVVDNTTYNECTSQVSASREPSLAEWGKNLQLEYNGSKDQTVGFTVCPPDSGHVRAAVEGTTFLNTQLAASGTDNYFYIHEGTQNMSFEKDKKYRFTFWLRYIEAFDFIEVEFFDENNQRIGSSTDVLSLTPIEQSETWDRLTLTVNSDDDYNGVYIRFHMTLPWTGALQLDDLSLVPDYD